MDNKHNIFSLEDRIQDLFDTVYPKGSAEHPSGRVWRPIVSESLGSMVPGGEKARVLQGHREYFKVDFQDFIDYATSELSPKPKLADFPDSTAVFYESLQSGSGDLREVHATVTTDKNLFGLSIMDAVIARDRVFVSVLMRFARLSFDGISPLSDGGFDVGKAIQIDEARVFEECATITFAPQTYSGIDEIAGPLGEWGRAMSWPPWPDDPEWRFVISGEYTSYLLDEFENAENPPLSKENIAKARDQREENYTRHGVYFEVARLGLLLPSYVDFMYDLVVTEKRKVGTKCKLVKRGGGKRGRRLVQKPIYKIISSIKIIRPEEDKTALRTRQWTAPNYSFLVHGHWRHYSNQTKKGRDPDGNLVEGKTWIRDYQKYMDRAGNSFSVESRTRDPQIVIGVKQTLAYARDVIRSYRDAPVSKASDQEPQGIPSAEWMASERAKLTAGLRYIIMKRDGFRCRLCGKSSSDENFVKLEVDHKIPVSKWGRTVEENLNTLCRDCNRGKSAD